MVNTTAIKYPYIYTYTHIIKAIHTVISVLLHENNPLGKLTLKGL